MILLKNDANKLFIVESNKMLFQRRKDPFNDWGGGRGCNNFLPALRGKGMKRASTGDIFDQPLSRVR